jgi:glycosyltransferase involved in cell wall biosynthesis
MPDVPKLSICVPSRNRQDCFRQTISDLTANPRTDVEFVFADNSDDPTIMDEFMRAINDPRVVYLPSQPSPLSMADNWERTVSAASGAWVCVIGDDDYVDPDLVDYILEIEARDAAVDAIGWNRAPFQWRSARTDTKSVPFSLANRIQRHPLGQITGRLFGWHGASYMPQCPYGIYHGAVARHSLERVKSRFSGRYFEHPTVDYDFSHKMLATVENLVYINRPMSVPGVAKSSNSGAIGDAGRMRQAVDAHRQEYGTEFEQAVLGAGFPFTAETGVAGNIMAAQFWFKQKYGYEHAGWEANFARAVSTECQLWLEPEEYARHVARIRTVFEAWEGGKYLPFFEPKFVGTATRDPYWGLLGNQLHINQEIAGAETPAEFYHVLQDILPERRQIEFTF